MRYLVDGLTNATQQHGLTFPDTAFLLNTWDEPRCPAPSSLGAMPKCRVPVFSLIKRWDWERGVGLQTDVLLPFFNHYYQVCARRRTCVSPVHMLLRAQPLLGTGSLAWAYGNRQAIVIHTQPSTGVHGMHDHSHIFPAGCCVRFRTAVLCHMLAYWPDAGICRDRYDR